MAIPPADLRVEPLGPNHDRDAFSCGVESLDRYLKTQASQDVRRKANAVFVMTAIDAPDRILGYFTLCATALEQGEVPEAARKHIPRYPLVSATLLGRLAVDRSRHGKGLGAVLLASALRKSFDSADTVGSSMVVVDAIDDRAISFYEAHGFVRLGKSSRLVIAMRSLANLG
ncbi:GNAT family N-acetyltransferase [Sphingosinicellaceae bacterium]|nr:GNAT family N-acetyltransferase [Sphingosinicellaceae bacterium]